MESEERPAAIVVGAGPGVSGSIARRLAADGYDVGLVGLGEEPLTELADELHAAGATAEWAQADVTDPAQLAEAVRELGDRFGRVDVLHFNPSAFRGVDVMELTVPELLEDVALGVGGLLTAVQAARPYLTEGARVTATGSMAADRPDPSAATLGVQKAALRNLVHSLDAALAPDGIRAVSVTVRGVLEREDTESPFHPDNVAAAVVAAARQDTDGWRSELPHPLRAE